MSSPVNVGDVLAGKYQVERVIGVGGMGVVVAAKHLVLGERVAIKFLLPQALARNDVVARFLREGQAAAKLRSEHTTRVHDVGKLESGAPFLVMEYLDGKDLGAVLRDQGKLPVEAAVGYLLQACEALAEAHAMGIVHRDLKPSNLFLVKRLDGSPLVKLIDFGISKIQLPSADGEHGDMTATAVMMGSPLYMAPEQMVSARDVDGRADIWSLGVLLHTALAGTTPFRGPNVMAVYEMITAGAPPVRTLRPDVPEGVEAAVLRCLQKDRSQRFSNVGELALAIAPYGPPDARFTADRIKRIVEAHVGSGSIPPPADKVSASVPVAALTPASTALESTSKVDMPAVSSKPTPDAPSQPSGSSAAIDPQATDGAWGQNMRPVATRKPVPAALIAAVAAVLIGAPVAFLVLRARDGGVAPPADPSSLHAAVTASAAQPPADPPPASAEPSVSPAGVVTPPAPQPTADPSVAPRTPSPTVPPPDRRRRDPAPSPPPPQPQHGRQKSPDDLFSTQK
jgi:serine/threonine-protein kinase